jgi:SAM-dependent methyltransferase
VPEARAGFDATRGAELLLPGDPRFAVDLVRALVPYLYCAPQMRGKWVAEIGCGAGFGAHHLAGAAREVHAYDANPRAIAWARAHYPSDNVSFRVDGLDPEPDPGGYDVVCSFGSLARLLRPAPLLERLSGLLAGDGWLYITAPNRRPGAQGGGVWRYRPETLARALERHFSAVTVLGIFGSARFREYEHHRRRLRTRPAIGSRRARVLQARLTGWISPQARRRPDRAGGPSALAIEPDDFRIGAEEVEEADDLLAIARR